jgi:pimeloyl-ACP methyl ester carboxylesterase
LRLWILLLAVVQAQTTFATADAASGDKATAETAALAEAAERFIDLLGKEDFAKATERFDAAMLKALPADKLKVAWEETLGLHGAFRKRIGSRLETKEQARIIIVTCAGAKSNFEARLVFDKDAKVTGLWFAPASPTGIEEIWEGKLNVGNLELRLVFHFFKQKDASYAGTMDSPDQGAKGVVLDSVSVKDDKVRVELSSAKMTFEGMLSKDGREITGDLKQRGLTLPLALKRVAKATEAKRPQLPKRPYPYDEVEVLYENKRAGVKLAGTLTLPRSKGPFPAVLLVTGSGPQDRDETLFEHKPFLVLADYLTRRGIAVLRVDDRGVGGSTGKVSESTTADFADDVLAGVAFLKGRQEIDAARIGVLGHSEGGIVAPLAAAQSRDIAFIVLLAGTGVAGDELLLQQGAAVLKSAGMDAGAIARHQELQRRVIAILREEKDNAAAKAKIREAVKERVAKLDKEKEKQWAELMPLLDVQFDAMATPWFRFFLGHDPRPALRKVTCPVLALGGAKDVQVDAKVNLPAIAAALKDGGNKDVTVKELPDLNHLFQTCKTGAVTEYAVIEETLAPVLLKTVADWIAKRMQVGRE